MTNNTATCRYDAPGRRERDTLGDGSYWAYGYNERSEVTGGVKHLPPAEAEAAVHGEAYGYGYDPIGNRRQTTVNGRRAGYVANGLNQYTSREVPGAVDVLGSADAGAVVAVGTGTVAGPAARRQGELFSAAVAVDNHLQAQAPELTITGRKVPAGGGPEVVSTEHGKVFLPKNQEAFGYDDDGNTVQDGRWDCTWDAENRLVAAETRADLVTAGVVAKVRIEYAYDACWRRIARTVRSGWNATASSYTQAETRRYKPRRRHRFPDSRGPCAVCLPDAAW